MRLTMQGVKVNVYYTGNSDSIDEVIAFGYSDDKGVGVARILGENMNPGKIIQMMNKVQMDGDNANLGVFSNMF